MPNSPKVILNEIDLTFSPGLIASGRSGVLLETLMGPIGRPDILINSWPEFVQIYGGLINGKDESILAKRALERGSSLRVSKLVHYTNPADGTTYSSSFGVQGNFVKVALSIPMIAGTSITVNLGVDGNVVQNYITSGLVSIQSLVAALKLNPRIYDAVAIDATHFTITYNAAIATSITAGGAGAPVLTLSPYSSFRNAADTVEMFRLVPKYPGTAYNNVVFQTGPASNGDATAFDLSIIFAGDTSRNEYYRNLRVVGSPTVANSNYLDRIKTQSNLATVIYYDLSAVAAPIVPMAETIKVTGAVDGGALVAADYIGDPAGKTGFYAFDGIDDIMQLAVLKPLVPAGTNEAGAAYASTRSDLQYFAHLDSDTESTLVTERDGYNINTSYVMWFGGKVNILDPFTNSSRFISELGDVLGAAAYSEVKKGAWYSFSGPQRGFVINCFGSGNKYGSRGNVSGLDLLAQRQINVVIDRGGKTLIWGSFTAQKDYSRLSFANVRRFHIFLKKSLGPIFENYIEEPCDIPTWKQIYLAVKDPLDQLVAKRAMFDYRWMGDQFANTLDDLAINNANDVGLGKYKARLFTKDIVSLQEFSLDIIITPTGVSFEDALDSLEP